MKIFSSFLNNIYKQYALLFLFFGASFGLLLIPNQITAFIVATLFLTISELLLANSINQSINWIDKNHRVFYFTSIGVSSLLGEGLGSIYGIYLSISHRSILLMSLVSLTTLLCIILLVIGVKSEKAIPTYQEPTSP